MASVSVNVSTYFPKLNTSMDRAWPLHLLALAAYIIAFFQVEKLSPVSAKVPARWWRRGTARRQIDMKLLLTFVPGWAKVLTLVASVNAFWAMTLSMPTGTVADRDGQHQLIQNGHVARLLTTAEYDDFQRHLLRGFSSVWIIFSFAAFIAAAYVIPRLKRRKVEADAAGR